MKKIITILFSFGFLTVIFPQDIQLIDSLQERIRLSQDPHKKLECYHSIYHEYKNPEPKKSLAPIEYASRLAELIMEDSLLAHLYGDLGITYYELGRFSEAIPCFLSSMERSRKYGNLRQLAMAEGNLGSVYEKTGNYKEALVHLHKALKQNESLGMPTIDVKNNLGNVYLAISHFATASEYYFEALQNVSPNDSISRAVALGNLGIAASQEGLFEKAIKYHREALQIFESANQTASIARINSNLGEDYYNAEMPDSALKYYKAAFDLYSTSGMASGIAYSEIGIGVSLEHMGDLAKALIHYKKALEIAEENGYKYYIALAKMNIGSIYRDQGKLDASILALSEAIAIADTQNISFLISYGYDQKAKTFAKMGRFEKAYNNQDTFHRINDSIDALKQEEATLGFVFKFEEERNKLKIEMLDNERKLSDIKIEGLGEIIRLQNQRFWIVLIAILVLVLFVFSIQRIRFLKTKNLNLELEKNNLLLDKEREELSFSVLLAQIKPHFLFNSLQSVNDFLVRNNPEKAQDFLSQYAKHFRFVLDNCRKESISLAKELSAITIYLDLEKAKQANRLQYRFEISSDLDTENILVPPMIIQPFVENSIKYGIDPESISNLIEVAIKRDEGRLVISIIDSGCGSSTIVSDDDQKISLGMEITKKRTSQWSKHMGSVGEVRQEISTTGSPSFIEINLPFIEEF